MNNPFLQEIAAKEKGKPASSGNVFLDELPAKQGNVFLDEIAKKEAPKDVSPIPLKGQLGKITHYGQQDQEGFTPYSPFSQGAGVQDAATKKPVPKTALPVNQPAPSLNQVIGQLRANPFQQQPQVNVPAAPKAPSIKELQESGNQVSKAVKEFDKKTRSNTPARTERIINLPLFGKVTVRQTGVGYEADFPVLGNVKGGSIPDLVKNAHKAYEQIKTTMAGPNFAAYVPSNDKAPPPNVQQSGIRTERLPTTAEQAAAVTSGIVDIAKTLNPITMAQRVAESLGAPQNAGTRLVKQAGDIPATIAGSIAGDTLNLPLRWKDVAETGNAFDVAGVLLEAATMGIAPGGKSAVDALVEAVGKRFGGSEKFLKALEALPLKPQEKQAIKDFFPKELPGYEPGVAPNLKAGLKESPKPERQTIAVPKPGQSAPETGVGPDIAKAGGREVPPVKAPKAAGPQEAVSPQDLDAQIRGKEAEIDSLYKSKAHTEKISKAQDELDELVKKKFDASPPKSTIQEANGKLPKQLYTPPKEKVETGDSRAFANRSTDIARRLIGDDIYRGAPKESVEQWAKAAVEKGYHEPAKAHSIAKEILDGTKKHLGKEETLGLAAATKNLEDQFDSIAKKLDAKPGGDVELSRQLGDVADQIRDLTKAGSQAGTEWSRTGAARRALIKADGSFAGMLARRQNAVKRSLTTEEIRGLKARANELETLRDAQAKRITELQKALDTKAAQEALTTHAKSGGAKPTGEKLAKVDRQIKDVSERLKAKWAENKPTSVTKSSLFGADIVAEQAIRVGKIAPEILELAKLHVEKGAITLAENTKAVVKHLRSLGIDDIDENDVAGVLSGRVKAETEKRTLTDYETLRREASAAFRGADKTRAEQLAFIQKREKEIQKTARNAQRQTDLDAIKAEREQIKAEAKAAREAEQAFWKEVRENQRAFQKGLDKKAREERVEYKKWWREKGSQFQRMIDEAERREARAQSQAEKAAARAEKQAAEKRLREEQAAFDKAARAAAASGRKTAIARWKASAAGKRAQSLERIEKLSEKLDYHRETGHMLGAKSNLAEPDDDILKGLRIKERSIERQLLQEDHVARQAQIKRDRTFVEKSIEFPSEIFGSIRNMLAMGDVSWNGIQGSLILYTNPKAWAKGTGGSLKALFSKNSTFIDDMEKLRESGMFDKIIASGVDLPGLQPGHIDEFFADTFLDAVPIYKNIRKGSQQAYDAGATITRAGMVESWIKGIESTGRPLDLDALKVLGEAANTLTGKASGKGGRLVSSLPAAGKTIFAPSWWLSQFQALSGKPLRDALSYGAKTGDWRIAKLMTKEYAKLAAGTMGTLYATAYALDKARESGLTDWHIGTDPNDKNFGKAWANRGGTMISVDFLPPQISAPVKFTAQMIFGTRTDKGTLDRSPFTRQRSLGSTFEGKYAPGLKIGFGILDSMNAKDNPGKDGVPNYPFGQNLDPRQGEGLGNLAKQSVTPIAWQQATRGITSPKLSPSEKGVLGFLSLFGRGPTIYESKN